MRYEHRPDRRRWRCCSMLYLMRRRSAPRARRRLGIAGGHERARAGQQIDGQMSIASRVAGVGGWARRRVRLRGARGRVRRRAFVDARRAVGDATTIRRRDGAVLAPPLSDYMAEDARVSQTEGRARSAACCRPSKSSRSRSWRPPCCALALPRPPSHHQAASRPSIARPDVLDYALQALSSAPLALEPCDAPLRRPGATVARLGLADLALSDAYRALHCSPQSAERTTRSARCSRRWASARRAPSAYRSARGARSARGVRLEQSLLRRLLEEATTPRRARLRGGARSRSELRGGAQQPGACSMRRRAISPGAERRLRAGTPISRRRSTTSACCASADGPVRGGGRGVRRGVTRSSRRCAMARAPGTRRRGESPRAAARATDADRRDGGTARRCRAARRPKTLEEAGLSHDLITQLVAEDAAPFRRADRHRAGAAARAASSRVIEPVLADAASSSTTSRSRAARSGSPSYRYRITDAGRTPRDAVPRAEPLRRRRAGAAGAVPALHGGLPARPCRTQSTRDRVATAFAHLVLSDRVLDQLGPAVNAGHSMFVYGPPGNGKTVIVAGDPQPARGRHRRFRTRSRSRAASSGSSIRSTTSRLREPARRRASISAPAATAAGSAAAGRWSWSAAS